MPVVVATSQSGQGFKHGAKTTVLLSLVLLYVSVAISSGASPPSLRIHYFDPDNIIADIAFHTTSPQTSSSLLDDTVCDVPWPSRRHIMLNLTARDDPRAE